MGVFRLGRSPRFTEASRARISRGRTAVLFARIGLLLELVRRRHIIAPRRSLLPETASSERAWASGSYRILLMVLPCTSVPTTAPVA